jgi:aldose 1-epimerase
MTLGNVRGAIPIHGFLTTNDQWQWSRPGRREIRMGDKQARVLPATGMDEAVSLRNTIEMTHRLQDGVLEIQTTITNMSAEPMR